MMKVLKEEIKQVGCCHRAFAGSGLNRNVSKALPGQFVNVRSCDGLENLLRRPISIVTFSRTSLFDIVFMVGCGTGTFPKRNRGKQ